MRVLSLGGGTQSCALALMSAMGQVPKLDAVIFADTKGERPETYSYLETVIEPVLADAGIPYFCETAGSLEEAIYAERGPVLPFKMRDADGNASKVGRYTCSYDYKRRPVTKRVKALCAELAAERGEPVRAAWKRSTVEQWIGLSLDEIGRMKPDNECRCGHSNVVHDGPCRNCDCGRFDAWRINKWPLIDMGMKRHDTIRWFTENGYPVPSPSSCWYCPHSSNDRWTQVKLGHPDLFERAVALDKYVRDGGGANRRLPMTGMKLYLHDSAVPLRDADTRTHRQRSLDEGQGELFNPDMGMDCEAGVCFT